MPAEADPPHTRSGAQRCSRPAAVPLSRRHCLLAALATAAAARGSFAASLPDVIAAAKPAAVAVGTFNAIENPRFSFAGSGFAVGDGTLVVTNQHVLPPAAQVELSGRLSVLVARDGKVQEQRNARVVASDRAHDLALLKIDGAPLATLQLDEAEIAREGLPIALIGFPIAGALGYAPVTHAGIIAAVTGISLPASSARQLDARALSRMREGSFDILQLDATAYPGNSGGPVIDAGTGRVVGVVNMVLVRGGRENAISFPSGISYAIPVRHVRALLAQQRP